MQLDRPAQTVPGRVTEIVSEVDPQSRTQTVKIRGWSWLNNDMVNLGCALMGAVIGILL